jgi:protein-disulfide isomerase
LVYKYFPNYGPDSTTAAVAAQCTNDQGKFWNYYDILYKNQGMANFGWASKDNLKKFGSQNSWIRYAKISILAEMAKNTYHLFRVTWLSLHH